MTSYNAALCGRPQTISPLFWATSPVLRHDRPGSITTCKKNKPSLSSSRTMNFTCKKQSHKRTLTKTHKVSRNEQTQAVIVVGTLRMSRAGISHIHPKNQQKEKIYINNIHKMAIYKQIGFQALWQYFLWHFKAQIHRKSHYNNANKYIF